MKTGAWIVTQAPIDSFNGFVDAGSEGIIISVVGNTVEILFEGFPQGCTHKTGIGGIKDAIWRK